jgi:Fur family ferric uptake transcriptional regulator
VSKLDSFQKRAKGGRVYDVLDALHGAGLVRRIEPAGSPAIFETRVGDNHHHLVCRSCGAIVDVECAVGAAPCLTPSEAAGFVVDEAEVVFWGLCPECQTKPKPGNEVLVNDAANTTNAENDAVTDEHREATP